jgi:phage terminase large subunit
MMLTPQAESWLALPERARVAFRAALGPTFVNDQQRKFFDCRAPEVLYSGAFRAGKSRIGCEKAYWLAKRYPGIPIGIFRKTAASLAASTERTLLHDVIPRGAIVKSNRTERWYELGNGSRIWLFGLDPDPITGLPSKVGSVELGWAFVDEAAECTEADWVQVMGRLSWPGIGYHQIAAATNPAQPTHWLKRRFTPPTEARVYLHASTLDNPMLPADYVTSALGMGSGYFRRRYIEGEWAAAEGAIWTLDDDMIKPPTQDPKRVVAGIDWGFVHAFACEVVGQSGSGRLSVRSEIYVRGAGVDQLVQPLADLAERHDISAFVCDPSEPGLMSELQRGLVSHRQSHRDCKLRARVEAARNDVHPGLQAVDRAIREGMTVDPSCAGLLGEIPGYVWKSNRLGLQEAPIEINDDACDALRYAVMAFEPDPNNPWANLTSAGGVV